MLTTRSEPPRRHGRRMPAAALMALVLVVAWTPLPAADLAAGTEAFERREYAEAFRILDDLAVDGDPNHGRHGLAQLLRSASHDAGRSAYRADLRRDRNRDTRCACPYAVARGRGTIPTPIRRQL